MSIDDKLDNILRNSLTIIKNQENLNYITKQRFDSLEDKFKNLEDKFKNIERKLDKLLCR